MRITQHSKQRIVERDERANCIADAKRTARQAFASGKTVGYYQKCPKFYSYLQKKRAQACECSVKVYHGNIYIWKGHKHTLVTAHPIPERFHKELEAMHK